jgi:hypothetical protein
MTRNGETKCLKCGCSVIIEGDEHEDTEVKDT